MAYAYYGSFMVSVRAHVYKHIGLSILLAFFILLCSTLPRAVAAETLSVATGQILPPGGNSCTQPQVLSFVPYVYDGQLNSFEFSVADRSYVAIAGTMRDLNIPFNLMTRRIDASGNLVVHVDVPSTPIDSGLPLSITMLAAKGADQPVCATELRTVLAPETGAPAGHPSTSSGSVTTKPTTSGAKGITALVSTPTKDTITNNAANVTTGTTTALGSVAPVAGIGHVLKNMCASGKAPQIWLILLAAYALIAGVAALGDFDKHYGIQKEWTAAAVVVPFLLLFGLWYFVPNCRTGIWAPLIAILIAIAGLATASWDNQKNVSVIALPGAPKP